MDAIVRDSNSRPYNSDPLLFRGFIYKEGDRYYRVLKTPIPSQYSYRKLTEEEVRKYVGEELVLTSQDAIERAYEFTGSTTFITPGRLSRRKDLEKIFNDPKAYADYIQFKDSSNKTEVCDDNIR